MDGGKLPSRHVDRRGVALPGWLQEAQLGKKGLLVSRGVKRVKFVKVVFLPAATELPRCELPAVGWMARGTRAVDESESLALRTPVSRQRLQ
jgi:hypothetical protein